MEAAAGSGRESAACRKCHGNKPSRRHSRRLEPKQKHATCHMELSKDVGMLRQAIAVDFTNVLKLQELALNPSRACTNPFKSLHQPLSGSQPYDALSLLLVAVAPGKNCVSESRNQHMGCQPPGEAVWRRCFQICPDAALASANQFPALRLLARPALSQAASLLSRSAPLRFPTVYFQKPRHILRPIFDGVNEL